MVSTPNAEDATAAPVSRNRSRPASAQKCPSDRSNETENLDLVGILSSVDATAYAWDLRTGRIDWETNAPNILGIGNIDEIATGSAYNARIAPEHLTSRLQAFSRSIDADREHGVSYRLHYRLRTGGERHGGEVRVEDHGRWWPGADGHPARARGVIRILGDRHLEQQQGLLRNDIDELTGQLNRIRLTDALATVLARAERHYSANAFLMISVNNLAVINETLGIEIGDRVIFEVGRRIRAQLRSGDIIGRYSSNKFGLVLVGCCKDALRATAERFIKAVTEETIVTPAAQLTASISLGGVIIPDQAKSVQDTINCAQRALDVAKSKRFDCFVSYDASPGADMARLRNKSIAENVLAALDGNRMRLVLQPIVSTKSGRAEIYEALLRMERPDGSLSSAGEFVPIVEQLGLSRLIDRRTLELTAELLKRHPELVLSVNVSALTCSDREWLTTLQRLTQGRSDVLKRMIVEITETVALEELDQSANFVDTLNELGCRVAIDDFGAGYTSFKNLKRLKVDMLKIDGAFIKNLADDASDQIFVKTMIELANKFGLETVAEWVGDERTAQFLRNAGITYMQGYYFGRPSTAPASRGLTRSLRHEVRTATATASRSSAASLTIAISAR